MNIMAFDTFAAVSRLKDAGFTEAQAKGVVETFRDVDTSEVATKGDLKDLRAEMREMELRLQAQIKDQTIKNGAMIFALGGMLVAIKFLG